MSSTTTKYGELEQIKKALADEADQLRLKLRNVETNLHAVTLAISIWKSKGPAAAANVELNPYLREFKGLTQVGALIKLALDSGKNRFQIGEARKVLMAAGLIKSKKNASNILSTTIKRSEKFKRVAPGEYELILKPVIATAGVQVESLKRVESVR
jgi:hypothetical protein